ncbi:VCBS domain-containing protein [Afipia sp. GAS231]|uniref:VCBS domain-containing protein n=1 Tax=Afipia sp. GAS231 TaxID=1882747 RepID=UPI00087D9F3E|nr:VCBS domain-containing protein [Afipia sp. GAS231]SDN97545.1 VCBS repeat-containing protein [Afipia sp. GAS231]
MAGKFTDLTPDAQGAHPGSHLYSGTVSGHAPADAIVISDAHLLFTGDFKRAGVDLVVSGDGHEVVLHDYFKGEKRAALASPDGAHLTGDIINALTGHTQFAQADGSASVAQVIGHVTKLTGTATAIRNGVSIILNQGDNVNKGDVVASGSDSTLGITFIDGTVFGLASNAKMVLNEMIYDPNGSDNKSLISLVQGTISFVAGATAKHGDMKVDTPVATMGIRGTAVLVEIDFTVPANGSAPPAKFQVLVEPDGTTGSYILFDKTTLTPIATVNQAGTQTIVNGQGGVNFLSSAQLSADAQKIITDVFALKFSDLNNPNTKTATNFTDSITQQFLTLKTASGEDVAVKVLTVNVADKATDPSKSANPSSRDHIPGPPEVVTHDGTTAERTLTTGSAAIDSVSGTVAYADINPGDVPTVSTKFTSFTYQNAGHTDVTATLTAAQLAAIHAVEAPLVVTQDPTSINHGVATWTYNIADGAFDFLAAGEVLTLTYTAHVDNNFALNNESKEVTFTITITGTNDAPVITTGPQHISFTGGTTTPGPFLTTGDATSGTLSFTDVDLTDTHTVSTKLTSALLSGAEISTLAPAPLKIFETALTASIAAGNDSTQKNTGTIGWALADLRAYLADFVPPGDTLTLVYTVTVTDSQGATSTQDITVTITGNNTPAVVWIATTQSGSTGDWNDAANWETGNVPTGTDDAIIITNQLQKLTPFYPVTINAAAFAKTVTMNDFGTTPPELDNNSTLQISGAFDLLADSIVKNTGTISVGGAIEVQGTSQLTNSGTLNLAQGGDFKDSSSVTNLTGGVVDLTGGILTDYIAIINGGLIKVESGAKLVLNGGSIDGGSITSFGTIEISGTGSITNDIFGNHQLTVDPGRMLTIDGTTITGGAVSNTGATLTVSSGKIATLNDVTISGGAINGTGTIDVTVASTINGGATLSTGNVTADAQLTLDGVTVDGSTITDNSSVETDHTVKLQGGATIKGVSAASKGAVTNNGTLEISGPATLQDDTVTNAGTVKVDGSTTLALKDTTISGDAINGTGTIDVTVASTINGGATLSTSSVTADAQLKLDGVTVDGSTITDNSTVETDHTVKLQGGATIKGGAVTNNGTLQVTGPATLLNDTVSNGGTIQVDDTLTLKNTTIGGGAVDGAGTIDVAVASTINGGATLSTSSMTADAQLKLDGVTVDGSTITDNSSVETDHTVKLQGGATIKGGAVTNNGTLQVTGPATLLNDTVSNGGTIQVDDTLTLKNTTIGGGAVDGAGTIDVAVASTINGGATLSTSSVTADAQLKLDGVTVDGSTITDNSSVETDHTVKLQGGATIKGASSALLGAVTNNGTLEVSGSATLQDDSVNNNNGTIQVDGGQILTLNDVTISGGTINDYSTDAASHILGGNIEVAGDSTIKNASLNNGSLKIDHGIKLTLDHVAVSGTSIEVDGSAGPVGQLVLDNGTTVTGSQLTVDAGDALMLNGSSITGGAIASSGIIDNVTGLSTITAHVTNTGTIEVVSGTLDLAGGLSGAGTVIIDAGATLQLAGADGQTFTFTGDGAVLELDSTALQFIGTIAGLSSVGGAFSITGTGSIVTTTGDALDFTSSGGTSLDPAKVTLTPGGTINGAANGIVVVQNGFGDIAVDPTGSVTGKAGDGIIARIGANGSGKIDVETAKSITGTGAGSIGILAENLDAANAGKVTVTQLGGVSGGQNGIKAATQGSGDIAIESAGAVTAGVQFGIRAEDYGTGSISAVTDPGSVINSGGTGISLVNFDAAIGSAFHSTIALTANGSINSGTTSNLNGSSPAGINAGYYSLNGTPTTGVYGDVTVTNSATITAAAGDGIRAFNYGVGNVTVDDSAGDITALGLTNTPIGDGVGIGAYNYGTGNVSVSTADGITIHSGGSGISANSSAAAAPSTSQVYVLARGTITSGSIRSGSGDPAAGILAGYYLDGAVHNNVHGNVIIDDYASITAAAGTDGIRGYNWGTGTVTITVEDGAVINGPRFGVGAFGKDGGNVSITNHGSVTGGVAAIDAQTTGAATATIDNFGHLTGNIIARNATFTNELHGDWSLDGTSTFTGVSTLANAGTIESSHTSVISGLSSLTNDGTIEVTGGSLKISGSISGAGSVKIDGGATFELNGSDSQTVAFNGDNAVFKIDGSSFGGSIVGFAATDEIDLQSIAYDATTTATFVNGALTIFHGNDSIAMTLVGDYSHAHLAGAGDATHTLITFNAADDAPAFAETSETGSIDEQLTTTRSSAPDSVGGTLHFSDIDLLDRPTATVTAQSVSWIAANHVTDLGPPPELTAIENALTLTQLGNTNNGTVGWTYSIADDLLDFLAEGETLTITSTVTLNDKEGKTTDATVTVTITGHNDAPEINAATTVAAGTVSEGDPTHGAEMTATGTITYTDVDTTDTHAFSLSGAAASYGTASVDPVTGQWTYTVSDSGAVDALAAGEHLADSFTVQVADNHGGSTTQLVSIDIVGTNDAPVINAATTVASGTVSEGDPTHGAEMTATGTITYTDVDTSDTHSFSLSGAAASYGTASVDPATGKWTYTVSDSGAVDALGAGEHLADSFTVQVADNHGGSTTQLVSIDIVGTNDAPVINAATTVASGTVSEGDPTHGAEMTATGTITYTDVDTSDTHSFSLSGAAASYGTASVDPATGKWTYTVSDSGAVDALGAGEHLADSFTVKVADNHGGSTTQLVSIDIVGTNDAPVANNFSISNAAPSGAGWILDTENGHYYRLVTTSLSWSNANAAAQSDGAYLATITSQAEQDFVATLATGNRAWLGGGATDDDTGAGHFTWLTGPEAGTAFDYTHWRAGEPNGGFGATEYVHIEGVDDSPNGGWNDAPDAAGGRDFVEEWGGQTGQEAFREDTGTTLTTAQLLAHATDVDSTLTVASVSSTSAHGGTVSLNGNIVTYHPAANYNGADSFAYTVTDGSLTSTATVSFNVAAVNDAPVASAPSAHYSATAQRDLSLHNTGLSVSDVDGGSGIETATLSASQGIITIGAGDSGVTNVTGNGSGSVSFSGTVAQINALLNSGTGTVVYNDNAGPSAATVALTLAIHDNGNTGGGDLSASASSTIDVASSGSAIQLVDATFLGGAGDQAATAVTYNGGHLYLTYNAPITQTSSDHSTVVGFTTGSGAPTQNFSDSWSYGFFAGVAADASTIYAVGGSHPSAGLTHDSVGGQEDKSILALFNTNGTAGGSPAPATGYAANNFFGYNGVELFQNVLATTQDGNTVLYALGSGQPQSYSGYIIAEYNSSGTLLHSVADSLASPSNPGGSNASAAVDWNGAIWVVGSSSHPNLGDTYGHATVWTASHNLSSVVMHEDNTAGASAGFNGVATIGNELYAVGNVNSNGGDFLIAKYNTDGSIAWSESFGGSGADALTGAVALDGHLYVVGSTTSGGNTDGVLMEINTADGSVVSTTTYGGALYDAFNSITTDGHNLYVAGESKSFTNGGNGAGQDDAILLTYSPNHAPVISTDQFHVTENHDNGTTTVSGLYVSDADSSDTFTLSATTGAAPESTVTPSATGPGATLADINTALSHGIVYNPDPDTDGDQPNTDSVTFTVTDSFGASDTVHFIFNQGDTGDTNLIGTAGKDVIFTTGNNDTLTGGAGADQFVFKPSSNANSDTITDFTPGQDHIDLRAFSGTVNSSNLSAWLTTHASVSPTNSADVLVTLDGNDAVTLKNVALNNLHVGDFIVSPHIT